MDETISVRIPKEELKDIEAISYIEKRKKSDILREVIDLGVREKKIEIAIKKFQDNEATASKASEIADMPLTSFLDILQKRGINFHYGLEDLREDIKDIP